MDSLKEYAKIDEKSFQMGGNIDPKCAWGYPKWRQEAKMQKEGVTLTRSLSWERFFMKMASKIEAKIDEKSIKKLLKNRNFLLLFLYIILEGFLMKNQWKIDRKMMPKSIQI